jgi:peptidoglycan/LPS O-acetylase OafA/YrhL
LRRALIALAAAGIVMGVLMAVVIAISDHVDNPTAEVVLSLLVAWSFLGTGIVDGVLGHLLFAFPSGRVEHPVDRFFVAVAYVLTTVLRGRAGRPRRSDMALRAARAGSGSRRAPARRTGVVGRRSDHDPLRSAAGDGLRL